MFERRIDELCTLQGVKLPHRLDLRGCFRRVENEDCVAARRVFPLTGRNIVQRKARSRMRLERCAEWPLADSFQARSIASQRKCSSIRLKLHL